MHYWLMKSEPSVFGVDDLAKRPKKTEPWNGVRNYQARNFMRDDMKRGDLVFLYHSSCPQPGIAGLMKISRNAYPDETQFDKNSEYFDSKATRENPRWLNVNVTLVRKTRLVSIQELRSHPELATMQILKRGNRLSITPVTQEEWQFIMALIES
ncbi:MAG TPA: EVE domain-containing protein [Burkholderiales bacterium]|nr:EVE domain-containing protein [Burkholderiales bacterium]